MEKYQDKEGETRTLLPQNEENKGYNKIRKEDEEKDNPHFWLQFCSGAHLILLLSVCLYIGTVFIGKADNLGGEDVDIFEEYRRGLVSAPVLADMERQLGEIRANAIHRTMENLVLAGMLTVSEIHGVFGILLLLGTNWEHLPLLRLWLLYTLSASLGLVLELGIWSWLVSNPDLGIPRISSGLRLIYCVLHLLLLATSIPLVRRRMAHVRLKKKYSLPIASSITPQKFVPTAKMPLNSTKSPLKSSNPHYNDEGTNDKFPFRKSCP